MSQTEPTLYERIGGDETVHAVVADFYRRVLSDPELSPFFAGIDAERLEVMQREFFAAALDGPLRYTGRPMNEVHSGLGIQLRHLSRFLDHLLETLASRGLDEDDRYDIHSRINTWASDITGERQDGD